MSSGWTQVFRGRGSVYALDEDTKQWADRGTSGTVIMFQNNGNREDVRIKWEKNINSHNQQSQLVEIWWRLTSSKLKPKGERALVLKAWATISNQQEILAIRFSHQDAAIQFAKKYQGIFPMSISNQYQIENIFKQSSNNQQNGNYLNKPKGGHSSMVSLPGSILGDDDKQFQQFQPNYGQENDNSDIHSNQQRSGPPRPPPRVAKKAPPPRPNQNQYPPQAIGGGQGGLPPIHQNEVMDMQINNYNQNNINANYNSNQARLSISDPISNKALPDEPPDEDNHDQQNMNGNQVQNQPQKRRVVRADPNRRPWENKQNKPDVNNEPVGLEYGHKDINASWQCGVCTYQNTSNVIKCSMCGLPRNKPNKPENQRQNDEDDDIYEDPNGLGGPRPRPAGNNEQNKWECQACTFSNHAWTDRCEVCQAKRRIADKPIVQIPARKIQQNDEAEMLHKEMMARQGLEDVSSPRGYNQIPEKRQHNHFNAGGQGQHPRMGHDWSCPICTLLNSYKNMRCEACNTARNLGNANAGDPNQINQMMNHMIHSPEAKYDGGYGGGGNVENDPFSRMWNMSMNHKHDGHQNPYNINLVYNDPNQPFVASNNFGMNGMYYDDPNQYFESTIEDFSRAASDIACYNDSPSSVFSTLRSVAKKLLKDDKRYRTLDTTNPKVMERLIGFEGVLDFLMLLGFESDAMGMKLICEKKPSQTVVHNAISVLNSYQQRFRMTNNGYGMPGYGMPGMGGNPQYGMPGIGGYPAQNMQYGYQQQPYGAMGGGGYQPQHGNGPQLQYGDSNAVGGYHQQPMSPSQQQIGHVTQGGFDDDYGYEKENKNDILTLEQIILWSTHENMQDNDTMETLIMTHKMFTDSLTLLTQLRKRFFVPIPPEFLQVQIQTEKERLIEEFQQNVQKRIQLKVIKALRDWMKHYWAEDFDTNEDVQHELQEWLKELSVYNQLDIYNANCSWVSKLYDAVKKEYLRLKEIDWEKELEKKLDILKQYTDIDITDQAKITRILTNSTAEELADQITLLDYSLFSQIEPRECVHQRWKDSSNKKLAPNILSLIQQFNNFTIFIQVQILREKSLKRRGLAIKRIIKMGEHFRLTRNYNSLCAVFSALNSAPIHRLKLAWSKVPDKNRQIFQEWSPIFSRDFNHRNLRTLLRKAGGNPCIPHIGVFLQDLVFIDEGNKKKVEIEAFNGNKMLNFNKCVRIADRIKNLQLFQNHKYSAKIKENRTTQKVLLMEFDKLKDVTEDQIWDMSSEIKKQDARENKAQFPFLGGNKHKGHHEIPPAQPVQE